MKKTIFERLPGQEPIGYSASLLRVWQKPTLKRLDTSESETGVNSTTDINLTFS